MSFYIDWFQSQLCVFIYLFSISFESFMEWKYELPIAIIWSPDHWIISLFILSWQYSSCRRNLFAVGYSIYYSLIVIDHWVYHLCIDIIRVLELRTHDSIFIIFMIQGVKLLLFILIIYDFFVNCNCVWCYLIVNYFNKKVPCQYWSLYALTCSDLKDDGSTLSLEVMHGHCKCYNFNFQDVLWIYHFLHSGGESIISHLD